MHISSVDFPLKLEKKKTFLELIKHIKPGRTYSQYSPTTALPDITNLLPHSSQKAPVLTHMSCTTMY